MDAQVIDEHSPESIPKLRLCFHACEPIAGAAKHDRLREGFRGGGARRAGGGRRHAAFQDEGRHRRRRPSRRGGSRRRWRGRQFLLLTLPAGGGQLKVETAAQQRQPARRIAASYAGLMDVFKAAA